MISINQTSINKIYIIYFLMSLSAETFERTFKNNPEELNEVL